MVFRVGQMVNSLRIGAQKEFVGEVTQFVEKDHPSESFYVVRDSQGRSWYRERHELAPINGTAEVVR